ncbi:DUF3806 domain-containing protein [Cellulomonas sp. PhB150]|uniref:DUF3806 domain-containing protein n=1 Tax=Cellulomonas sp. PhB150 TaxID=2485188 RepID=UPI000F4AA514|nr:DUF3806 domain-containing protein [Cellulomonas sp. PhB150]ROS25943.1 uncharacterized protein DUF3806 [Cellulomonas sp. PhB150]
MVPAPVVVGMRPLAASEEAHLDRLRDFLTASRVDVTDPRALGALVDAQLSRWQSAGAGELPDGMLAAFGVGIGDLVRAAAPGAHWVLRTSAERPGPALLAAEGSAAVVPLDDVRSRWAAGTRDWVPGYVSAAAQHLAGSVADAPAGVASAPDAGPAPLPVHAPQSTAMPSRRASRIPRPRIPADLPVPPSVPVQILALRSLDRALEVACASADPTRLAFYALETDGILRPVADLPAARAAVTASGADRAAVIWVAGLDDEGHVADAPPAVLVEAGEIGVATLVVGHRFTTTPVEDLVIVGQGAPLL